jgi:TonB-linked SusC/RagA family outer membrane protein
MKILSFLLLCVSFSAFAGNASSNTMLLKANKLNSVLADQQQTFKVSGTISDEQNQGIPGATIRVKGTRIATTTNATGAFTVTVPNESAVLVFSYVGYVSQEILVGKQQNIKIVLKEDMTKLEEIVVVGFGTQKKVNLTGSVATVNAKQLETRPVVNVGQSLQGTVAGLNITQSGSQGGSLEGRPSINIRGIATIGQGSNGSPLILIDGMEGDINALNSDDIDNISVLKDAAASSIYGARAPFGVILVTTKKGKVGKAQISYTTNFRNNTPILLPKMMDAYKFALFFNDANKNSGSGDFFSPARIQRIQDYMAHKPGSVTDIPQATNPQYWSDGYGEGSDNVDWFGVVFRKSAQSQEHALSINGGTDNITYYISGNFLDQGGLIRLNPDTYQRYTTSAKINAKLSSWASVSYTARFTREEFERPATLGGGTYSDLARQGWPMLPFLDPNGHIFSTPSPALGLRDGGRDRTQNDWNYQQVKLTLEPIKGWKVYADINYKTNNVMRHWDTQKTYNYDTNNQPYIYGTGSSVHEEGSRTNYFSPNIYSDYTRSFGDHNFKLMAGYQSEENQYRFLSAERQGIIVPGSPVIDITSGNSYAGVAVPPAVGGNYSDWATSGYFGRLNYDYKGRYLVEANLRYDGTSRFRIDKRWQYFPSASIGWNVTQEPFWQNLKKYVSNLKFRASYGELGNQNTSGLYPTYLTEPFNATNSSWLLGSPGAKQNTSSAAGIVSTSTLWETVRTYNGGLDLGFLKNRLTASFDYFTRFTNHMIGPGADLPLILGTGVPPTNNTDLKTQGFEFDLAWQDRTSSGLGYNVHFTLADSKTHITSYPNVIGALNTYYKGQEMGEIWGYTTIGIAKTQAEMDAYLATLANGGQNALGSSWKAGDIMFKDLNGDGKIDGGAGTLASHGDRSIIGNSSPHYSFGMDLSADYKGFDVRCFFQGILKRDVAPQTGNNGYYFWGAGSGGIWWSTGLVQQEDYFRDDPNHPLGVNLDSYYPRPLFNGKNQQVQTRYLQNAAYLRLKNLQVGYTIPQAITKKIGITKLRLYVSGENLLTVTKMSKIFDPETADAGYGGNTYPLSRVYSFGLNVNF